ncbi:Hypothetical protein PHPALM_19596 [Phytophthora palmivora]|uniref:DDE-1 domain-containing protein n=1 Tax=Phytophthora palmivora TaxID=4796 RepID=A0A2P4XH01_9STRA|nr:Hypothetical protein PHPALM_19596 [Phytophthora palmivora]
MRPCTPTLALSPDQSPLPELQSPARPRKASQACLFGAPALSSTNHEVRNNHILEGADVIMQNWINLDVPWECIVWSQLTLDEKKYVRRAKSLQPKTTKQKKQHILHWFRDEGEKKFPSIAVVAKQYLGRVTSSAYQERGPVDHERKIYMRKNSLSFATIVIYSAKQTPEQLRITNDILNPPWAGHAQLVMIKTKRYTRIAVDYTHKRIVLDYIVAEHTYRGVDQLITGKRSVQHPLRCYDSKYLKLQQMKTSHVMSLWHHIHGDGGLCGGTSFPYVQTTPEDAAEAKGKFSAEVRAAIVEHGITKLFNADQTDVLFEYLPRHTVTTTGTKTMWVKCSGKDKEQAIVMLLDNWHGNKYAPFVIFKSGASKRKHVQVRMTQFAMVLVGILSFNFYTAAGYNATDRILLEYHFGFCDEMEEKILLRWDAFSGHWTQEVKDYATPINTILLKVPSRYTTCASLLT